MENLTNPLIGGTIIGLTAAVYLLLTGKIIGISGILTQLSFSKDKLLPGLFIFGLIVGGSVYGTFTEQTVDFPAMRSPWLILIAGLLVGYGTRLGSGCTSGHGVCGISRLSPRSIVATLTFMAAAIVTVFIMKQF